MCFRLLLLVVGAPWALGLVPVGGRYRATLDFGRETNTWMPPRWAVENRALFSMDLMFREPSLCEVSNVRPASGLALGLQTRWDVESATWVLDGSTLRVSLSHGGFCVGDCALDAGTVDLALPAFPSKDALLLSSREGIMSIVAYRAFVRRERRMVGVWFATPLVTPAQDDDDPRR